MYQRRGCERTGGLQPLTAQARETMAKQRPIPLPIKARDAASRLRMLAVFLCMAVFAWGLESKLSLYRPAVPLNPAHVAKLMADNQGAEKSIGACAGPIERAPKPAWAERVETPPRIRDLRARQNSPLPLPTGPDHSHALFFRPPPPLAA